MQPTPSHLVLIPSYNPGAKVLDTVEAAAALWPHVWVVDDGSSDGSSALLQELAGTLEGKVRVIVSPANEGKGAAILRGVDAALASEFTHCLTMDADGQHPAHLIPDFMAASLADPEALILGVPVFDASAPALRVKGRRVSNWWANLETRHAGIGDSLYGFRVYPMRDLRAVMSQTPWMRRFDFDPEAAVRLCWHGLRPVNIPAPVKYLSRGEGGVSHFNYLRDNLLLTGMHIRLLAGFVWRLFAPGPRDHA